MELISNNWSVVSVGSELWFLISPDAHIIEAALADVPGAVDVAQIDDDRALEQLLDAIEVERAESVPFRHDRQGVGALDG